MTDKIRCEGLNTLMHSDEPFALFDVRERGEYNQEQIYQATSLPRRQIEFQLAELVPLLHIRVVVYDDGGERAFLAAETMEQLGYRRVHVLEGGLPAWKEAGLRTVAGVNVPSKEFGEKVHVERKVPDIPPRDLSARLATSEKIMIFDVRTEEEHRRMCIPCSLSVPGGDLIHWAEELRQKPDVTVIIHCAGRTRSVIGTQTLRRLGLSNVYALRNGNMGWILADLEPEQNSPRKAPNPSPSSWAAGEAMALGIAREEGIPMISLSELLSMREKERRQAIYLVDVRSPAEYGKGHIPGSLGIPGGQAVQRTDDFIAVRKSKIIFISDGVGRAVMTAYWYRQMGFQDVAVLKGGVPAWIEHGQALATGIPAVENSLLAESRGTSRYIQPAELAALSETSKPLVLHVGTSQQFDKAHVPGSRWISRGWLELKIDDLWPDKSRPIILTCPEGQHSTLAAHTLSGMNYREVTVLDGGVNGWLRENRDVEKGLEDCIVEPNDVVLSASVTGDKEAMKRYLEWEQTLGGTLDR